MYQHKAKLSWLLDPIFVGSVPLQNSSSFGNLGVLEALEASDPSLPDDGMVSDHHVNRFVQHFIVHVDFNMLLKTAPKIHILC